MLKIQLITLLPVLFIKTLPIALGHGALLKSLLDWCSKFKPMFAQNKLFKILMCISLTLPRMNHKDVKSLNKTKITPKLIL